MKMRIVEVTREDIEGHAFNGYDLMDALNQQGWEVSQIVRKKDSRNPNVYPVVRDVFRDMMIRKMEDTYGVSGALVPYASLILQSQAFKNADLAHYHFLFWNFVSYFDYPLLMNCKPSVLSIHDSVILTGKCVHPLGCGEWMDGCKHCRPASNQSFKEGIDAALMWKLKKEALSKVNPYIIVPSAYMEKLVRESPITAHFDKIFRIPFGVKVEKYDCTHRREHKLKHGLPADKLTIGFRVQDFTIKGENYIFAALESLRIGSRAALLTVGPGKVPEHIRSLYSTLEFGWLDHEQDVADFLETCDIFLMPSLSESFGVMAIEAMAAGCTVVCFEGTTVAENTDAPRCGVAVKYASAVELAKAIKALSEHPEELRRRGERGRALVEQTYRFESYVERHRKLYEAILSEHRRRSVPDE